MEAKNRFEEAVAEKEHLNAVLHKELAELEELHGDLHSTAVIPERHPRPHPPLEVISGTVQRELAQTRMCLPLALKRH